MYPKYQYEREEQDRYKTRLAQHAEAAGYDNVADYVNDSTHRYVVLSNADQPEHWMNEDEFDETDWVVYETREDAEDERQLLITEGDYGHRVVTEKHFLRMKGLV